jgi:hypothetical protein
LRVQNNIGNDEIYLHTGLPFHYINPSPRIAAPATRPAFPRPNASVAPPVFVSLVAVLIFAATLPVGADLVAGSVFAVVRAAAVTTGVLKPNSTEAAGKVVVVRTVTMLVTKEPL